MHFPSELIWLLVGIGMIFLEFFIPGVVIVFFGAGAISAALTTWVKLTPTLAGQLVVFMVTSVIYLFFLRRMLKRVFMGKETLGKSDFDFLIEIGKVVSVTEYIQPGEIGGKVRYQGTLWAARSDMAIAPGESVCIKGYDNLTLIVEKIKKENE
jgi:membrane protein implicated in regulation of membrane protease activity